MTVRILYVDLRAGQPKMVRRDLRWRSGLTAAEAIGETYSIEIASQIEADLSQDSPEVTVSWAQRATGEHSGIGGVDALNWPIPDDSLLTILYETEMTTDELKESSTKWMLENEH